MIKLIKRRFTSPNPILQYILDNVEKTESNLSRPDATNLPCYVVLLLHNNYLSSITCYNQKLEIEYIDYKALGAWRRPTTDTWDIANPDFDPDDIVFGLQMLTQEPKE